MVVLCDHVLRKASHNPVHSYITKGKRTFPDWIAFLIFAFSSLLSELDEGIAYAIVLDVAMISWLAVKVDDDGSRPAGQRAWQV